MNDLTKVIKRLELIKNLISLEDSEAILEQVSKLKQLQIEVEVQDILNLLSQEAFGRATTAIEAFLNKNNQLTFFTDPEIDALRFEAKTLEKQVKDLSNEKAELDKLIHEFNIRHSQELGQLIIELLKFRKEQSKNTPQQEEAEKDYEEFYTKFEAERKEKIALLSQEEQKELKNSYRKATKLCHPDVVNTDQKEAANKIFVELTDAYQKNNLKKVNEILEILQTGHVFKSKADISNEKQTLLMEIKRLRQQVEDLNAEIANIKGSQTFTVINKIKDWDDYFFQTKNNYEIS